jgi:O-antigen ligase
VSRGTRWLDSLLFATAFVITFAKIRMKTPLGDVYLSDVTASAFVLAVLGHRVRTRDWRLTRTAAAVALFFGAFLVAYLVGFYNLGTEADRDQFAKGIAKFVIHFAFLLAAIAYLSRRSPRLYWQTLAWFLAGFVVNAAYGLLQLGLAETTGTNLDEAFLGRLGLYERGGISVFGVVGGQNVYRTNALTLDPNHLGVMLVVPLLILFPLYLRLERGHRLRAPLASLLVFFALVELTTLSRSGLLGVAAGLLVLGIPYRHLLLKPRFLVPLAGLAAVVAVVVASREGFFQTVFEARTQTGGTSTRAHFQFYSLIRPALEEHPSFGLGYNTFSVYYEFLTGRTNWGPHSYYVAVLTETGIVGAALFAAYLAFLLQRLTALRRVGRALAAAGDRSAARVRPLAWGLTAALVGTLASNTFYLTLPMYYFYVFAVLVLAGPVVFGRAERGGRPLERG